jgi:alkanesulfonate monooxygenase SsuD/methylene tetrahydromethanopterin reductase-like flavin-dependent oxidoreductase (luciferase family)
MEVGMFYLFETLGEIEPGEFYRQALDHTIYGEELGFSAVCPAEHHFSADYGIMPRVELFLMACAVRTQRMKLWPMLIIAPLAHPIRLAEDVALIDQFSQGRMIFSVGTGYRKYEHDKFGVDVKENPDRLRETIEIVIRLFREDEVTYRGRFYSLEGVHLEPRPYQKPHPPVVITTTRDDQIRYAAERGYWFVPAAGFNPGTVKKDLETYQQVAGTLPPYRPFFKWIYVGENHKKAVEEGTQWILKTLYAFAQGGGHLFQLLVGKALTAWGEESHPPDWLTTDISRIMASGIDYYTMVKSGWTPFVCGDPHHIREVLLPYKEAGASMFIGGFMNGPMPREKVRSSMRLFAEKVLPHLQ